MEELPQEIVFLSHDSGRTGAPLMLLALLRKIKAEGRYRFRTVLKRPGPLEPEFRELGPTMVLQRHPLHRRGMERMWGGAGLRAWDQIRLRRFAGKGPALFYCNSVAAIDVLDAIPHSWPVLLHAHELEMVIQLTAPDISRLVKRPIRIIAPAGAVRDNLVENHGVDCKLIDVIHEGIEVLPGTSVSRGLLRAELDLPADARLVGGAGVISWRKGSDLFVQLARAVLRKQPGYPVYFPWIGNPESRSDGLGFLYDVRHAGLEGRVLSLGERMNVPELLSDLDVLALTSREDPFPLVCLEASAGGVPFVCFADAGGMTEFASGDCGVAVPYLEIDAMADAIVRLLNDEALRCRIGENARRKVEADCRISVIATKIQNVIGHAIRSAAEGRRL
jgi:glycosyltransferase involved in cell wall biosynthesis